MSAIPPRANAPSGYRWRNPVTNVERFIECDPLDLDALERRAVEALRHTFGDAAFDPEAPDVPAFWAQKGIEAMRLAVAEAKRAR